MNTPIRTACEAYQHILNWYFLDDWREWREPTELDEDYSTSGLTPQEEKLYHFLIEQIGPAVVKSVWAFPNGNVVVIGENGEQIPKMQGRWDDMKEDIYTASDSQTEWHIDESQKT